MYISWHCGSVVRGVATELLLHNNYLTCTITKFQQLPILNMATSFERRDVVTNPCNSSPPPTFLLPSSQDLKPALGRDLPAPWTINGVPYLLHLPLELRWQIFLPLIRADEYQICAHAQTHMPFVIWNGGKREQAPKTGVQLSVLLLNRQIYQELIPYFYSENLIYLEQFFASDPIKILQRYSRSPVFLPRPLHSTCMGRFVKQIGFSVLQEPRLETAFAYSCEFPPRADDEIFTGSNRLRFEIDCQQLRQHLPNLQLTYVNIFTHPQKPEEKFLLSLIKTLHTLPGRRILVIHGSNREKVRVSNILRFSASQSTDLVLGGCLCHIQDVRASRPRGDFHNSSRDRRIWFENVLWVRDHSRCTLPPYFSRRIKGCLTGCLLCKVGETCVHDPAYKPRRLGQTKYHSWEHP